MIWHILRKDVRLLWAIALAVAAIHFAAAGAQFWLGPLQQPGQLVTIAYLLSLVSLVGVVMVTLSVMHQDAVPGVRQDWLVRPINRAELIGAKLLFVALIVQGPLLLADLGEGLASGFSFPASLGAAAARNATILCFFSLPALMIGAVTRNAVESFLVAIAGLVIYVAVILIGMVLLLGIKTSIGGTGLSWIMGATWYTLAVAGTAVVMSLQFFRRQTTTARYLIGAGGAVVILSSFLPWRAAFAMETSLSKQPSLARAVALAFNPQLGRFKLPAGAAQATGIALYVPLRVAGVPAQTVMLLDRADIQIRDATGQTLYTGKSNLSVDGLGSIEDARLEVRQRAGNPAPIDVYQKIFVPSAVYARLRGQPVEMEIDYSLTLFHLDAMASIAAIGGHAKLQNLGSCVTGIDGEGDDVQLHCISAQPTPSCFTAVLEDPPNGLHNPEAHRCEPDYSPFALKLWPDALYRFAGELPFFDARGLIHYPVDGTKLVDARLEIETYEPRAHFTRKLTIRKIELSDLAGPLNPTGTDFAAKLQ